MIYIVANDDSMDNLAMEDLTLMEQFGFLSMENFEERAFSSENKKNSCSSAVKFQGGNGVRQVTVLVMVRTRLEGDEGKECRDLP